MSSSAVPRNLLLVLAHGVGLRELPTLLAAAAGSQPSAARPVARSTTPVNRTGNRTGDHGINRTGGHKADPTGDHTPITLPITLPPKPMHSLHRELDAVHELRELGIEVDRSSFVLRPAGRTDQTAVELLAHRATGPAAVTVFAATSVLAQASAGGAPAAAAAAAQLGLLLARLGRQLRRGDLPEVWLLALGSACAVHTAFDLEAAWRQRVLPPLAGELALHCTPGLATIVGDNQRALDLAAHTLAQAPFARHGRLLRAAPSRLRFLAHPNVAFASRTVHARAPRADEAAAFAVLPHAGPTTTTTLDLAGFMARFWMRAVALHLPAPTTPAPQPALRAAPAVALLPLENVVPAPQELAPHT